MSSLLAYSNVFGYGLTARETLSSQLSDMLMVEGRPAKVLNVGVPGYGYDQFYLSLVELGPLKEKTQVIVVTQPRNDGINTCNDVDYNAYKPVAQIQSDAAVFSKVLLVNPACESHFSARFHRMNQAFRLKSPKRPSWLHRLSLKSHLVFLLINARHLTPAKIPNQVKEVIWNQTTPEAYATSRLEQVRKNPQSLAVRVWPEIRQFDDERRRMIERVGFLLSRMDQHLKAMRCQILIVL